MEYCVASFNRELEKQFDIARAIEIDHAENLLRVIDGKLKGLREDLRARRTVVDARIDNLDRRLRAMEKKRKQR